jgi:hypothetical protein
MAVNRDELREIEAVLRAPGDEASAVAVLRTRFPHLSWTRCDASDVTEEPFQICGVFDLHLLDGADHCVHITGELERATGVVLARRAAS